MFELQLESQIGMYVKAVSFFLQEVFNCMLRNLFEEYKFFPQYPDKELHITAQLFGGIIEQGLVRYVLFTRLMLISITNLMHKFFYSITICMLRYNPRHVSSINMPIFRSTNCINTASGIVTLCKQL